MTRRQYLGFRNVAVLGLLLARPHPARALFGVGDIVFDPANTAQTINVLRETRLQLDALGSLLGVSTQQFDQLVSLATALGNAVETGSYREPVTPAQLEQLVRSIPGLESADLGALFNSNGLLDAFMGVSLGQWQQAVEDPDSYFRAILSDPAIARVGSAAGLSPPAVAYAQWYASLSPEDRHNLGHDASADISGLLADDWLGESRQRRVNLEGLAAASRDATSQAGRAQTLTDQQHAQSQLSAATNQILIESAAQNADAAEVAARAAGAQSGLLRAQEELRRNAGEMLLDSPP